MKTLFMETTQIQSVKTVGEIQHLLGSYGASKVLLDFNGKDIDGISFMYPIEDGREVPFRLPCRWKEIETILRSGYKRPKKDDSYESWAKRVAWRQILRWVQAQMALVETNMVKVQEVFLPYAITKTKETIYEQLQNNSFQLEFKK